MSESSHQQTAVPTSWVTCPICDESNMRREEHDEGAPLIFCVNHNCGSNGGTNFVGLEKRQAKQFSAKPSTNVGDRLNHVGLSVLMTNQNNGSSDDEHPEGFEDLPPLPRPLTYGFLDIQMLQYGRDCVAQYNRERESDNMSPEWKGGYSMGFEAAKHLYSGASDVYSSLRVAQKVEVNAQCNDLLDCAAMLGESGAKPEIVAEIRRAIASIRKTLAITT